MSTAGVVVSFTRTWTRGLRPLRISVALERRFTCVWTAEEAAAGLVRRACHLLNCEPRELKLKHHPMDGLVKRSWTRYKV